MTCGACGVRRRDGTGRACGMGWVGYVGRDGRGVWDGTGGACGTGRAGHVGRDGGARGMQATRQQGHLGCASVGIWDVMGGMA